MRDFRARLDAWQRGAPMGQRSPPYNAFIGAIETIGAVEPRDRIGVRFREDGLIEVADFQDRTTYLIDLA